MIKKIILVLIIFLFFCSCSIEKKDHLLFTAKLIKVTYYQGRFMTLEFDNNRIIIEGIILQPVKGFCINKTYDVFGNKLYRIYKEK